MAIKKTDRGFETIVNDVHMQESPIEYIVSIRVTLQSGKVITLQRKEISHVKSTAELVEGVAKDDAIDDMQVVLDYDRIRQNVELQVTEIFKSHFKN